MPTTQSLPWEIEVSDLCRTYQLGGENVHALRGVKLQVRAGEFLGIVGVSGSGKSTLLHLIGGLDSPSSGMIRVADRSLERMNSKQRSLFRRDVVGFVFQSFYLVPNLTAEENLRLALTLQGTYGEKRTERARQGLERVGLAHRRHHKPGELSGGEQQRVTIARAVLNEPRILLADEPTGNLDRQTARQIMELINTLRHEFQMTVIMVTHDEQLIRDYCDRLIPMQDGQFLV